MNIRFDFSGKTCVVTGGASGMGREIVNVLAAANAEVFVADLNQAQADEIAARWTEAGHKVFSLPMDGTSLDSVANAAKSVMTTAGKIDFLVNSMGIGAKAREGESYADTFNRLLNVDLHAIFNSCHAFGEAMIQSAQDLSKWGISVVGIPGTIDNDIVCTDYTIGFDTAANTAVECIDKLRDTMQSHERCSVVEVMGRHAGYLALYVGLAVGATAVLVPEHPYDFHSQVAEKIRHARLNGKTNFMIVVAEGCVSAMKVGEQIKAELGLDPRVTILGHIQRGGSPTAKDRVIATRMGYEAVRVLAEGGTNRVIVIHSDQVSDLDIDEGLAMMKTLNQEEFQVMKTMTGQ